MHDIVWMLCMLMYKPSDDKLSSEQDIEVQNMNPIREGH